MQRNISESEYPGQQAAVGALQQLQSILLDDQGGQLSATRARLARIARARGVAPDAVDDVVQETLLEAWNHLDRLYEPAGFALWIDEICRNVCRRYAQRSAQHQRRYTSLSQVYPAFEEPGPEKSERLADYYLSDKTDPLEELCRQDLLLLLDRALGSLSGDARQVVKLYHLLELPHAEIAARLGLSGSALNTRLHRARRQLREILSGPLRSEAEAFGLALDEDVAAGWHETRLWCPLCARRHLQGCFIEREAADGPNLHLRCPDCSRRYGLDTVHSMGLVSLAGLSTFRPAWKRTMHGLTERVLQGLTLGELLCLYCGKPASIEVLTGGQEGASPVAPYPFWLRLRCAYCRTQLDANGDFPSIDQIVCWSHPRTRQFVQQHERLHSMPARAIEHEGEQAICFQLAAIESNERLTILAQRRTLQVLAIF